MKIWDIVVPSTGQWAGWHAARAASPSAKPWAASPLGQRVLVSGYTADWMALRGVDAAVLRPKRGGVVGGWADGSAWSVPEMPLLIRRAMDVEPSDDGLYCVAGAAGVRGLGMRWRVWGKVWMYGVGVFLRGCPENMDAPALAIGRAAWGRMVRDGAPCSVGHGVGGVVVLDEQDRPAVLVGRCGALRVMRSRSIVE